MEQDFQQLINSEKRNTQNRWRSYHTSLLALFTLIVMTVEVLMYFFLTNMGLREYNFQQYCSHFIIIPDIAYIFINLTIFFVNKNKKISAKIKNYVTCMAFSIFCLIICFTHDYFPTIFACGMIAILLTVMYCDIPLTLITSVFLIIGEGIIGFCGKWDSAVNKNTLYGSYISMALILLIIVTISSIITIKWENKRLIFISKKQLQITQLKEQTIIDPLTGLHNRRALRQFIDESTKCITYAMTDIDHFKRINDSYGHETGDDVLIIFAKVIQKYQGEKMESFRFGGDEFLLSFLDCNITEVEKICHSIQNDFTKALNKEILQLGVAISVGIASYKPDEVPHDSIQRADNALYVAKVDPHNKVKII